MANCVICQAECVMVALCPEHAHVSELATIEIEKSKERDRICNWLERLATRYRSQGYMYTVELECIGNAITLLRSGGEP